MKKVYSKPEAELVSFYSDEEVTALDGTGDISNSQELVELLADWT